MDSCGFTHKMVENELLPSGFVNGFISGKHLNRYNRLHPLVTLGLQLEVFTKKKKKLRLIETLKQLQPKCEKFFDVAKQNEKLSTIISQYLNYI